MATCGLDKSIKIWNTKNFDLIYEKQMDKNISSISFHPTGFHLAINCKDKIFLINLLIDKLEIYNEFNIRDTKFIKFSNGGQYLAII